MKTVGFISKQMYHTQTKTMMSPEMVKYTLPLEQINIWDIERKVMVDDEGVLHLEKMKDKAERLRKIFVIEKEENRPIINEVKDDRSGDEGIQSLFD